jgi:thioesterase domain-containing protein
VLNFRELARHVGDSFPFYGLQAQGVDGRLPPLTDVAEMAQLHLPHILRAWPKGPFVLGGYSGGGVVAIELARRLIALGHEVPRVILLDTFCPGIGAFLPPFSVRLARMMSQGMTGISRQARATLGRRLNEISTDLRLRYYSSPSRQAQSMPFELRDLQLTRSFNEAAERYQPSTFDGPVTLFRAREVDEIYAHAGRMLLDYPDMFTNQGAIAHAFTTLDQGIERVIRG